VFGLQTFNLIVADPSASSAAAEGLDLLFDPSRNDLSAAIGLEPVVPTILVFKVSVNGRWDSQRAEEPIPDHEKGLVVPHRMPLRRQMVVHEFVKQIDSQLRLIELRELSTEDRFRVPEDHPVGHGFGDGFWWGGPDVLPDQQEPLVQLRVFFAEERSHVRFVGMGVARSVSCRLSCRHFLCEVFFISESQVELRRRRSKNSEHQGLVFVKYDSDSISKRAIAQAIEVR